MVVLSVVVGAMLPRVGGAQRQTFEHVNAWFTWFSDLQLNPQWAIDWDISLRRSGPVDEVAAYLWRVDLRRNINPNLRVAAGYAGSDNHPYGKIPNAFRTPEHRVFEQVQLLQNIGRVQIQHRYRMEQRWSGRVAVVNGDTAVQNWIRTNRARYLVRTSIPLQGTTLDVGEWFANASTELFMNFGANVNQNIFDQNRLQVTVGRRVSDGLRLEAGYMEQLIEKANGRQLERNHTLLVVLTTAFKR